MKTSSKTLIDNLSKRVEDMMSKANKLKELSGEQLNAREGEGKWSALECLEHLNLYSEFYIPEFQQVIEKSKHPSDEIFKSTWFGNYSAESMLPKEKLNKMKTFKDKNPLGSELDHRTIERFIDFQEALLQLLQKARTVSLNKNKCNTTLPIVKFNLGDTFRFIIYHQERHMVQAEKAVASC